MSIVFQSDSELVPYIYHICKVLSQNDSGTLCPCMFSSQYLAYMRKFTSSCVNKGSGSEGSGSENLNVKIPSQYLPS